jgi:hypothetical protein
MRLYLDLKGIGVCSEKGRAGAGIGYRGRMKAEPDRPIRSLILPLLDDVLPFLRYSSPAECDAEIAALKEWVAGLENTNVGTEKDE